MVQEFEFDFHPRYRRWLPAVGITPDTTLVTVTDEELRVRFSAGSSVTSHSNVHDTFITGPYRAAKAIGVRGSFADSGVTFGTTPERGLCVMFAEKVPAMLPFRLAKHGAATLTVADVEGLQTALDLGPGKG